MEGIRESLLKRAENYYKPRLEELIERIEKAEDLSEEDLRILSEIGKDYKIAVEHGFGDEFISRTVWRIVEKRMQALREHLEKIGEDTNCINKIEEELMKEVFSYT